MRASWLLVTRNWSASRGTALACVISVALGVAVVLVHGSFHETALHSMADEVVTRWIGRTHLTVYPPGGHWGTLDASIAEPIAALSNVGHVTARLQRRMRIARPRAAESTTEPTWSWIDAVGIDPETESYFRALPNLHGRMLDPDERGAAVIEGETAAGLDVAIGGEVAVTPYDGGAVVTFTVVGLYDTQRVAEFAPPTVYLAIDDVRALSGDPSAASAVDIMLDDPSPQAMATAKQAVEAVIAARNTPYPYRVESAASRQMLVTEAERISGILSLLVACISLLTSFFIIVTTMSVSLMERRNAMGIQRCVGMTRRHMATLLLLELFPLGVAGTALGLLLGVLTARFIAYRTTGEAAGVEISSSAFGLAIASGLVTTLVGALAMVGQATRTTPMIAVNPHAKPARLRWPILAGVVGVAILLVHEVIVRDSDQTRWMTAGFAFAGVGSLYLGYILMAPAVVVLLGPVLGAISGAALALPSQLGRDQLARAPWRSSGVCWVLMVGVSMIAYISISAEAILAIWDFPGRLPEAFIWSPDYIDGRAVDRVRDLPGVTEVTTTTDMECEIGTAETEPGSATESLLRMLLGKLTRPVFVAGDPQQILSMIKVAFIEGSQEEAKEKLELGGYVLIPTQTARNRSLHVGDRVRVTVGRRTADFEIAGVVQSPALDMAVTAFQATSYMQLAAASALLGTQADLRDKFGLDVVSMVMCNFELPAADPPPGFDVGNLPDYTDNRAVAAVMLRWAPLIPNERETFSQIEPTMRQWLDADAREAIPDVVAPSLQRYRKAIRRLVFARNREELSPQQAWTLLRERLILLRMADELERPDAIIGSLRRLKLELDRGLRRASSIITWLPSLLLVVAAIGIANLMMINIKIRGRQIAMLRAVGAVKSQILRMVLSEAAILGVIGSILGLALGFHEAYSRNRILGELLGFRPEFIVPVGTVAAAVALTVTMCLLAGLPPARHAARENVLSALQVS